MTLNTVLTKATKTKANINQEYFLEYVFFVSKHIKRKIF